MSMYKEYFASIAYDIWERADLDHPKEECIDKIKEILKEVHAKGVSDEKERTREAFGILSSLPTRVADLERRANDQDEMNMDPDER